MSFSSRWPLYPATTHNDPAAAASAGPPRPWSGYMRRNRYIDSALKRVVSSRQKHNSCLILSGACRGRSVAQLSKDEYGAHGISGRQKQCPLLPAYERAQRSAPTPRRSPEAPSTAAQRRRTPTGRSGARPPRTRRTRTRTPRPRPSRGKTAPGAIHRRQRRVRERPGSW